MLHEAEQRGGLARFSGRLAPVKIPEQRPAVRAGLAVFLRTPHGPERRPVAFEAFAVGQDRLERREDLQALVSFPVAAPGVERPEIAATFGLSSLGVALGGVRVKVEKNAVAVAVHGVGVETVVFVNRPRVPTAFEKLVRGSAEERPDAIRARRFAAPENHERPRRTNLVILFFAVVK